MFKNRFFLAERYFSSLVKKNVPYFYNNIKNLYNKIKILKNYCIYTF